MTSREKEGMLTESDRENLGVNKAEYAYSESAFYNRKAGMRQAVVNAMADFDDVQRKMEPWNWNKFVELAEENEREVRNGMIAAIALFYELHRAAGWDFRKTMWDAIDRAYTHGQERGLSNRIVEGVSFKPDLREPRDPDEMRERINEKIESDELLTNYEMAWAAQASGKIWERVRKHAKGRDKRRRVDKAIRKHTEDG